nr:uncharacterized protein LOC126534072 isoform X2 [Dermacentor andersoni]
MAQNALFAAVLLLASVTFVSSNDLIKYAPVLGKRLDIRKFVGTKEPIWTSNTTTKEHISCEVDQMKSMTQGSILFTRKFDAYRELHPITKNYEGIFPQEQQNVMQLRKPGIKKEANTFVGTRQPIWTWNTTTKERVSCNVDQMKSLAQKSIIFTRTFYTNNEFHLIVKDYMGVFPKEKQNVMLLRKLDNNFAAKETILYLNEKYHCGVIRVTSTLSGHPPYYDLRVWNSVVGQGPHEKCVSRFTKLAQRGHVIYDSTCQSILHYKGR